MLQFSIVITKLILSLFFAILWLTTPSILLAATPIHHPQPLVASKNVLKLPFRTQTTPSRENPYSVGHFTIDYSEYTPTFMGTDYYGRMFVMDPIKTQNDAVLKCFTSAGRFDQSWRPLSTRGADLSGCGSTRDGHVWVGLTGDTRDISGLPIVIYKFGQKMPVADWRDELPVAVDRAVHQALLDKRMAWKRNWNVSGIEVGGRYVSLLFTGDSIGDQDRQSRYLWILVSTDGATIYKAQVLGPGTIPLLSSEGKILTWISDSRISPDFFWSKVQIENPQTHKVLTLIDLTRHKEPYAPYLQLGGNAYPPIVELGSSGSIYLTFSRQVHTPRAPNNGSERAVVVLNGEGNLRAFLPWTSNCTGGLSWIKIRPSHEGILRINYLTHSATIVSYSVP
jgi:hypothetical protein